MGKKQKFLIIFLIFLFIPLNCYAQNGDVLCTSEHFILKAFPGSPSDAIPSSKETQEFCNFYERVIEELRGKFGGELKGKITVVFGGKQAQGTGGRTVAEVYSSKLPLYNFGTHEIFHVALEDLLGPPPLLLLTVRPAPPFWSPLGLEELACTVFELHFWERSPQFHIYARVYQELNNWPSLETILSQEANLTFQEMEFPLESFIPFLLENYPPSCFKALWQYQADLALSPTLNLQKAIQQAYGKPLAKLEEEWRSSLEKISVESDWYKTVSLHRDSQLLLATISSLITAQAEPIKIQLDSLTQLNEALKPIAKIWNSAPYGILIQPLKDFSSLEENLVRAKELSKKAEKAVQLLQVVQRNLGSQNWNEAYGNFYELRGALVALGEQSLLPWVDKNLEELKGKVPPELVRSLEGKVFPWWGWVLIGCGAAGVLGLGGWLFICKKRAHQKGKGQQP